MIPVLNASVSQEMYEAVSVVPVTQGLASPREPDASLTFDPNPSTYDPWRLHLDLHRQHCARLNLQVSRSVVGRAGGLGVSWTVAVRLILLTWLC